MVVCLIFGYTGCEADGLNRITIRMDKPVFCPGCRNRDTFERQPKKDGRCAEDDRTLWEAWVCNLCGYTALNCLLNAEAALRRLSALSPKL